MSDQPLCLSVELQTAIRENKAMKQALSSLNAHLCDTVGKEEVCRDLQRVAREIRKSNEMVFSRGNPRRLLRCGKFVVFFAS